LPISHRFRILKEVSEPQEESAPEEKNGRWSYVTREPVILTVLSALALVFFLAVTGLSHAYDAQQESLGARWFMRGAKDLQERRFQMAVSDLRAALLYSRDNDSYQLSLAEALIGEGRMGEASAYLLNLWEREPENGQVNLELARIAVQKGDVGQALRYYHNAIYAIWPGNPSGDQDAQRSEVRLELIEYLLRIQANTQAQSELIALAANLDDDPSQHTRVADLFFQAHDYEHALAEYSLSLKSEPPDPTALAGAGRTAFELRRYTIARRYLEDAVAANPSDAQSAARLKITEGVLQMDPFRRQISVAERDGIVIEDFAAAGERLKSCAAAGNSNRPASSSGSQKSLADSWTKMKPQVTERGLRRNPELVEMAMGLVFDIERTSNVACGTPTGTDMALLLISKLHEGN
jgi:tetratricopeptide (TPR) repeat protein